ncbi:MAG: chemotaxis protein CheW [Cyanobacteria bacterium P01_F01_bin.150]
MADLLLLFRVGRERYAIEAISVVEVIPKVNLSTMPKPPQHIVGQFNYQGHIVPVLDLSQQLGTAVSRSVLSTRIVLINLGQSGEKRLLGLMVEQVTDTLRREHTRPIKDSMKLPQPSYLGEKLVYGKEIIQCLCVDQILSNNTYDQLLTPPKIVNSIA